MVKSRRKLWNRTKETDTKNGSITVGVTKSQAR